MFPSQTSKLGEKKRTIGILLKRACFTVYALMELLPHKKTEGIWQLKQKTPLSSRPDKKIKKFFPF